MADEVRRIEPLPATETRTPAQGPEEQRSWQSLLLQDANGLAVKAVGGALGSIAGKVIYDKIKANKSGPPDAGQGGGQDAAPGS